MVQPNIQLATGAIVDNPIEMIPQLKEKFALTKFRSDRIQILTVLPKSWSINRVWTNNRSNVVEIQAIGYGALPRGPPLAVVSELLNVVAYRLLGPLPIYLGAVEKYNACQVSLGEEYKLE